MLILKEKYTSSLKMQYVKLLYVLLEELKQPMRGYIFIVLERWRIFLWFNGSSALLRKQFANQTKIVTTYDLVDNYNNA